MSPDESACCRAMHHQCGEMAKTGCCRVEVKSDVQPQLASSSPTVHFQLTAFDPLWVAAVFDPKPAVYVSMLPDEHSPPGLIVVRISNLRI